MPNITTNHAITYTNWIGEHEITKLKKKIFASNPQKRTQKHE